MKYDKSSVPLPKSFYQRYKTDIWMFLGWFTVLYQFLIKFLGYIGLVLLIALPIRLLLFKETAPRVNGIVIILVSAFLFSSYFVGGFKSMTMGFMPPKPTAIVIDADTGEPIKGAVAIAIWRKWSDRIAWWEGGIMDVTRIEESVSDVNGEIFIPDYWKWWGNKAQLHIYKFGYCAWNQRTMNTMKVKPGEAVPWRKDFDINHRVAKLEKWPENFSFIRHDSDISLATQYDIPNLPTTSLFRNAIDQERIFRIKERSKKAILSLEEINSIIEEQERLRNLKKTKPIPRKQVKMDLEKASRIRKHQVGLGQIKKLDNPIPVNQNPSTTKGGYGAPFGKGSQDIGPKVPNNENN